MKSLQGFVGDLCRDQRDSSQDWAPDRAASSDNCPTETLYMLPADVVTCHSAGARERVSSASTGTPFADACCHDSRYA